MAVTRIAYPEWTDYRDRSGLDPLGMQNGSIDVYQRLLPGISNVTLRMRYYGLYAWLSVVNAKEGSRTTDPGEWRQLVRRSKALYAPASVHNGDQAGVAGSRWAQAKLDAAGNRIALAVILRAEKVDSTPSITLFQAGLIQQAFEHAGVRFGRGGGVLKTVGDT